MCHVADALIINNSRTYSNSSHCKPLYLTLNRDIYSSYSASHAYYYYYYYYYLNALIKLQFVEFNFYVAYHITRIISDKRHDQRLCTTLLTTTPLSGLSQRSSVFA